MNNAFGLASLEIKDVIRNTETAKKLRPIFIDALRALGIPDAGMDELVDTIYDLARMNENVFDYEWAAYHLLDKKGYINLVHAKLLERSKTVYSHVKSHIQGKTVLDLGCGDGRVGEYLSKDGYTVTLADVYKNQNISSIALPFVEYAQDTPIPLPDHGFDTTLVLMVLHHTNDPKKYIEEARRVTKPDGKLLLIESVYGVTGAGLDAKQKNVAKNYLSLSSEDQRMANIFFDHFYNRIFYYSQDPKTKVNVPFNFNTPENWKALFEASGYAEEQMIELGIDLPIVPEYHTLHIFKVK